MTASSAATGNNNVTMTIHTTNSIQGNNLNVIKQEEAVIRKAILSDINYAIFLAKGSVKSSIPVNVNTKIINQLGNTKVDTTQGIDMTKKLIATEVINAINTTTTKNSAEYIQQKLLLIIKQYVAALPLLLKQHVALLLTCTWLLSSSAKDRERKATKSLVLM